jgi:stress-induced morphogen
MTPQQIKSRLQEAYPDGHVDVTDLTGTQDHYSVFVSSKKFSGLSRIQCHKHVMSVFDAELKTGEVHALTIKTEVLT